MYECFCKFTNMAEFSLDDDDMGIFITQDSSQANDPFKVLDVTDKKSTSETNEMHYSDISDDDFKLSKSNLRLPIA